MKKLTALLTAFSLSITACSLGSSTAYAFAETDRIQIALQNISESNSEYLQDILNELEIDSIEALIQEQLSRTNPPVDISRIKNLDGISGADVGDAMYILNFLSGDVIYGGDYNDMDVTGEYIIDKEDATAYLAYYVYCISHNIPTTNNYSAPGTGNAPSTSFENIEYEKHIVGNDLTRNNDTYYTIFSSGIEQSVNQVLNNIQAQNTKSLNEAPVSEMVENRYAIPTDKRIVRNAGTGAIIGNHLILTNAHCLYNIANEGDPYNHYNTEMQHIYLGMSNGQPQFLDATAVSYHIPTLYFTYGPTSRYDYAIIVVSENLLAAPYSCKKFPLGLALDGAWGNQTSVHTESFFPGTTPAITDGVINSTVDNYIIVSSAYIWHGGSGAPLFTTLETFNDPDETYDTEVGIECMYYYDDLHPFLASGSIRIIRPILQFCFNNPNL